MVSKIISPGGSRDLNKFSLTSVLPLRRQSVLAQVEKIQELFLVWLDDEDSGVDIIPYAASLRFGHVVEDVCEVFSIKASSYPWSWSFTA